METVIDWSNAPEGATHYQNSSDDFAFRWLDMNSGEFGSVWHEGKWKFRFRDYRDMGAILVARPEPAWTGEGLPPVGPVEYKSNDGWRAGECLALKGDYAVIWVSRGNVFAVSKYDTAALRPIRTDEQIAAEEHRKAVEQLAADTDWILPKEACEAVLAAGYRKQVAP